jgi:formylglycine-generating enzyme required for sulfatase activity
LILIPPGKFRMGDEDVTLTDAYYLGKTEVTQAQWIAVMRMTPWQDQAPKGANRPATFVTWQDAKAFCEQLTAQEKNGTYRLPTEAEWEYACRAGTATRFSFGDDGSQLGQFAWISDNARKAGEPYAHDVALKKPNAFGLFDMHGNVWEYCDGQYSGGDPTREERPRPVQTGALRIAAGGSWDADLSHAYLGSGPEFYCRSSGRRWPTPTVSDSSTGFRVVWVPPAAKK